jgi:toxin-antitoxin system PIN domain toxin
MVALLDVNLLIALAWPNHVHHASAHAWFGARAPLGWATCSIVELGFVRVSSNARAVPAAVSPQEAASLLRRITALRGHQFWTDDIRFAESPEVARSRVVGHQQVTDAHLVALAVRRGGCLATLDRGVRALVAAGLSAESAVEVVPAVF